MFVTTTEVIPENNNTLVNNLQYSLPKELFTTWLIQTAITYLSIAVCISYVRIYIFGRHFFTYMYLPL